MKRFFVLCAVLVLGLVDVESKAKAGCLSFASECFKECPERTHPFLSNCGDVYSQKTCLNRESKYLGKICDINRCECDEPYYLDEDSKLCVPIEECDEV